MRGAALGICCVVLLFAAPFGTRSTLADDAVATATVLPTDVVDTPTDTPAPTVTVTAVDTVTLVDTPTTGDTSSPTATETATPVVTTAPPTPSATPTKTTSASGTTLLSRMRSAITAAKSVHVLYTDVVHPVKNTSVETTTTGDLSWRGNRLHESTTVVRRTGSSTQTIVEQRYEVKIVGARAAWRPGGLSWTCQALMNVQVIKTLQAMQSPLTGVHRLADATVNMLPAEHVRATIVSQSLAGNPRPTIDVYIATATNLPVKVTVTTPSTNHLAPEKVTEAYSNWREAVTVSLPRTCR
jgi:hypothetical protein